MKKMSRYLRTSIETRALRMLRTLSVSAAIRAQMNAHGYTEAEHEEGWKLCIAVAGFGCSTGGTTNEDAIRAARERVTDFTANDLPCLAAGVKRVYPERYDALFGDLTLDRAAEPIVEATLFLDRYEALAATGASKADHAVVAFLAKRTFTSDVARAVRESVHLASSTPETFAPKAEDTTAQREEELVKLHAWLEDWTTTARRAITRKDQLHRMGIGRRSPTKKSDAVAPGGVPVTSVGAGGASAASGNGATNGNGASEPALSAGATAPQAATAEESGVRLRAV